jgi:flagellar hook-length control protein FliK
MEVMTPSVEHCGPRSEFFADTLKTTLQQTAVTPASDIATAGQGDFEAAIALLGSLTTPMYAASPPPEAVGLARPPVPEGEQPSLPDAAQSGPSFDDQRIMPIVGAMAPTGPPSLLRPIGDEIIPPSPPSLPLPPSPPPPSPPPKAQPWPIGDARVPITPVPTPPAIAPPVPADAAVQPSDLTQTNDEPIDTADVIADNSSSFSAIGDHQPELIAADAAAANSAANSAGETQEAARTRRPIRGDADALAPDAGTTTGNEAIAVIESGTTVRATNDVVKVARSLAQLPAVLSDLAQQARTESSPRRVVIPLDPPALGHVTVEIIVRADSVKVSLQHGDEATFNALNAQRPAIEAALEANGLHLSGFDVSGNQQQRASHTRMAARHFAAVVEQVEPDGALRL